MSKLRVRENVPEFSRPSRTPEGEEAEMLGPSMVGDGEAVLLD